MAPCHSSETEEKKNMFQRKIFLGLTKMQI